MELVIAATIAAVGWVAAALVRRRRREPPAAADPEPYCGCGDHYAYHDMKQRDRWGGTGLHNGYDHVQCNCRQYVGPQPLEIFYAPQLSGEVAPRPVLNSTTEGPTPKGTA
jgi:hypothetical protein